MKKCEELLLEFGIDFVEGKPIPEDVRVHFNSCQYCIEEIKKQERIYNILEKIYLKEEEIPKFELPPVLRKKDKIQFLLLSVFFFLFFLFFHSILNFEFLRPYFSIFSNLKALSFIKLNLKEFFIIIILISLIFVSFYQIKKLLKKI